MTLQSGGGAAYPPSRPDQQDLAEAFVGLAKPLRTSADVTALTGLLVRAGVELLGACAAVVAVTGTEGGTEDGTAATDERLRMLEAGALAADEGPAYDCMEARELLPPCRLDDDTVPWPDYAAPARALGYAWVTALPLCADGDVVGALVLYGTGPLLPGAMLDLGRSLAEAAALSLLREREAAASRTLATQLEHALASRVVIEQAKGIVAAKLSLTVGDAFGLLRRHARSQRRRLVDVAEDVVAGRDLPEASASRRGMAGR